MSSAVGFVYVLKNDCLPGLLKIGHTYLPVDLRMRELFSTGLPMAFDLVFTVSTSRPRSLECMTHATLDRYRVNRSREFFRVTEIDAVNAVERSATLLSRCLTESEVAMITVCACLWRVGIRQEEVPCN